MGLKSCRRRLSKILMDSAKTVYTFYVLSVDEGEEGMTKEANLESTEVETTKKTVKATEGSAHGRKKAMMEEMASMDAAAPVEDMGADKSKKTKKSKLVRDSFKFPQDEYSSIETLKRRCLEAGLEVKKSELVRAGLLALKNSSDKKLIAIVSKLEKLKTGRPAR